MPINEIVEKSCFAISNVTCYDLAKDFSGPFLTAIIAFITVKFAFKQIEKQHKNTLEVQRQESKRNTRVELFKDISALLDQVSAIVREVSTYCMVKKYSNVKMAYEINLEEYLSLSGKLNQALLAVVSKIESHEIVNLKLFRVFRFSLQSIVYDLMKIQHDTEPTMITEKFIILTADAQSYLSDFQVCMQNIAYGEVFDSYVPARMPADKRYKVITNDPKELDSLMEYFLTETNWGKNIIKYEQEAHETFPS